jgi:hypothetical protein
MAPTARGTGGGPPASVSCSVTQRRDPLAVAPADTSWARCSTNGSSSGSSLSNSRNKIGPAIASSNSSGSTGAAASPRATARSMISPASSSHVLQNRRLARAMSESRSRSSWPGPGRYPGGRSYVAKVVTARLAGKRGPRPLRYRDRGVMATIGRRRAVAKVFGIELRGLPAFLTWGAVHLAYLVGWGNRVGAISRWLWTLLACNRRERLISVVSLVGETQARAELDSLLGEPSSDVTLVSRSCRPPVTWRRWGDSAAPGRPAHSRRRVRSTKTPSAVRAVPSTAGRDDRAVHMLVGRRSQLHRRSLTRAMRAHTRCLLSVQPSGPATDPRARRAPRGSCGRAR